MKIREDAKKAFLATLARLRRALCGGAFAREPQGIGAAKRAGGAIEDETPAPTGVILQFPLRGEALLVRLAEVLRRRDTKMGPSQDLRLWAISRYPKFRLWIDRDAFVEVDCGTYHVAVEAAFQTRITLDTPDFDVVADFVAHYVAERRGEPMKLETAS